MVQQVLALRPATGQLEAGGWEQEALPQTSLGLTPWVSGPEPSAYNDSKGLTGSRSQGPFGGCSVLGGAPREPAQDGAKQGPLSVVTGKSTGPADRPVSTWGWLV